jgi:hypothetical protein
MSKKKRAGKSSYTSKGVVGHPKKCKTSTGIKKLLNQQAAWMKGKRVMLVVDKAGHKVEAREVWGLPPQERRKASNNDD